MPQFSQDQIDRFREHGYAVLSTFWSDREVEALQAEVNRFKREGLLHNVATEGDGTTHSTKTSNLQLCPMSPHSELFKALPFAPKVHQAVSELIGDPVVLHLDQVFLKPSRNGSGTNWHQDNAYFKLDNPMMGTAMWTAVHAATLANGTIRVIPGSQRDKLEHSRDPQSDHHIRCYPDESQAVPIELPAGGVVFFAYGVAHATGGNGTDSDRAGAAYHFLNKGAISDEYFRQNDAIKHPVLTGPEARDGVEAYGVSMEDAWERAVSDVLDGQVQLAS